ncbi:hypothetical protein SNEBB_006313 [Seison nebaliae]|nr:hypothetical protein SNEBB_006313 [Seison nebaliae]
MTEYKFKIGDSEMSHRNINCFHNLRQCSAAAKRNKFCRRLVNVRQMDFQSALRQILQLFYVPQQVFRKFKYRKDTKNQYATDDPAFIVLLSLLLIFSSIILGVVLGQKQVEDIEWAYSFDVQINAFLPLFIILHLFQIFFFPILTNYAHSIVATMFSNSMWLIALHYYFIIIFLGFKTISNVKHTEIMLTPLILCYVVYVISILFNWNLSIIFRNFYVYRVTNT